MAPQPWYEGAWIILAPRTKGTREHWVPLSGRATEIRRRGRSVVAVCSCFGGVRASRMASTALSILLSLGSRPCLTASGRRSATRDSAPFNRLEGRAPAEFTSDPLHKPRESEGWLKALGAG